MAGLLKNRWFWMVVIILAVGGVLTALGFKSTKLHVSVAAEPVFCVGGERASLEACASGFPITNSLILTLIVDVFLVGIALAAARNLQLVPRGLQNLVEFMVEAFYNFAQALDPKNVAKFFPFCASVFFFFLVSNYFGLFPGVGSIGVCAHAGHSEHASTAVVASANPNADYSTGLLAGEEGKEEPTSIYDNWPLVCEKGTTLVPLLRAPSADLNVTLAWALVSVFLIELFGFQALGIGYLSKFFNFKEGAMMAFVGLIEFVSEIIRILAFALRIFGNIFAGEVLLVVMSFLFAYLLPAPFYAFEFFVAFMQAFVFAVLSLLFMSLATQAHGDHGDDHAHH